MAEANRALEAADVNLEHSLYATAINRAYYAVFYAASALLLAKDIARSKHSGVISAFRQHYVKPGLIETEYSQIYGKVMAARVDSDYEITARPDRETARNCVDLAGDFEARTREYLEADGWL